MPKRGVTDVNLTDDSSGGASEADSDADSDSASTDSADTVAKQTPVDAEAPVLDEQQEDERDKQDEEEERDEEQEEKHEERAPKEQRGRSRSTGRHRRASAVAETGRTSQDPPAATNKPHIRVGGDSPRRANRRKSTIVLRRRREYCKRCRTEIIGDSDAEEYNKSGRCVDCAEKWAAKHGRRRRDPSKRRRRTLHRPPWSWKPCRLEVTVFFS